MRARHLDGRLLQLIQPNAAADFDSGSLCIKIVIRKNFRKLFCREILIAFGFGEIEAADFEHQFADRNEVIHIGAELSVRDAPDRLHTNVDGFIIRGIGRRHSGSAGRGSAGYMLRAPCAHN